MVDKESALSSDCSKTDLSPELTRVKMQLALKMTSEIAIVHPDLKYKMPIKVVPCVANRRAFKAIPPGKWV